ncbi:melanoma cell adhesion molecule b isoform X3 [Amphiprion ocellaris]|uniref:Ig-like domain-containing protein n=1 Tax=Amphiprion ocellaris TaxID=80972 RepID=A0AAQ6ALI9_AMPOC|nr:melanoma cell adhesion molecule b isoform X3 [Amphiprion ocellaris]
MHVCLSDWSRLWFSYSGGSLSLPLLHHLPPHAAPPCRFLALLRVSDSFSSSSGSVRLTSAQLGHLQHRPPAMALRDTGSLLVGLLLLFHTWGAWAEVVVSMEDRVEVSLRETAQITCMFTSDDGIGGMTIQWSYVTRSGENQRIYHQDSLMTNVEPGTPYTDRISVNSTGDIVLSIRNVQLEDEVEFVCLVTSLTDGSAEGRTKLLVFEAPNLPTIEGVQTGISVNEDHPSVIGSCEVKNGYPKPNITWYKGNTPLRSIPDVVNVVSSITTESSGLYSVKSELRMKVEKEDKDAQFYCEVTYFVPGGMSMTETSLINITVYYPSTAVNIWVESPKGQIKEGDTIELHCSGNGNPQTAIFTIRHLLDDTTWETNMLVLENVTRQNSGVYECISMDMDTVEEISQNTSLFVHYLGRATVISEKNEVYQGEDLNATCNAVASLPTETAWLKDDKVIAKGHILTLQDTTFDTAGTYVCKVTVPDIEGMETSGTLRVYVQGPPEIMGEDFKEIGTFDSTVDLSCNVRGFPVPKITWTNTDGKDISTSPQTVTEEGAESVVSVKVTSNMIVFCNASNEYGADAVTFSIKAIKTATPIPPKKIKKEGNGVIIAVIIICILLLAILGSVLYFLYKKGKICGRSGKQDLTKEKSNKDNIVVEMKSDNTEEAILLGVNGEKQPPNDQ